MAEFVFNCPECKAEIEADDSWAGGTAQCPGCNKTIMIPMPGIRAGMIISGFKILERLGSGGMGEVWLAEQTAMERKVALKILSPALTNNQDFVDRFMAEVKMSAKLHHPNIVTAFDAGNENGIYYLAISYVDGAELDDRLKIDKLIPEKQALEYVRSIAEALKYAWNKFKILHRDIKPSNIMVDSDNEAKLMDMGISKSLAEDLGLTMTGVVIGTPYYMSPEQAKAEQALDFRADIYSLGATLYHLVTGQVPFDATTAMGILAKHITDPFPSPKDINPELSDECVVLLETMMAKKKEERQASWEDVVRDINLVLDGKLPATPLPQGASTISTTISRALNKRNFDPSEHSPHMAKFHYEDDDSGKAPQSGGMRTAVFIASSLIVVFVLGSLAYLISSKLSDASMSAVEKVFEKKKKELGWDVGKKKIAETKKSAPEDKQLIDFGKEEKERARKAYDERNMQEMWDLSVNFFNQNPEMFEMAIDNFEKIKKSYPGTKYAIKADIKIKELREQAKQFKQEQAGHVIEELKGQAKKFADKKEYVKAAEVFRAYSGKYKLETEEKRESCAEEFIQKARELEEQKEKARMLAEKKKEDFFNSVAEDVMKGKFSQALDMAEKSKESGCVKGLKKSLGELARSDEIIIDSLKRDIGKEIIVDTPKGKESGKIKRVKNGSVYYMTKMGRGYIQKKIPIKKLPINERLRRLDSMSRDAKKFYSIHLAIKIRKFEAAEKYMAALPEPLSDAFFRELNLMRMGKVEGKAKNEFVGILRRAGVKKPALDSDAIRKAVRNREISDAKLDMLRKAIDEFRDLYGGTEFVKKYGSLLDLLVPSFVAEGRNIFSGKILRFNMKTLEIELLYDFKDKAQLKDWQQVFEAGNNFEFFAEDNKLVMQSPEHGAIICQPKFTSLKAEFTGTFIRDFCEAVFSRDGSLGFVVAGFGGRTDGYISNLLQPGMRVKRLSPTSFKQGAPVDGTLVWNGEEASFSVNGKKWPKVPFKADSVRFGLLLRRSKNTYSRILLKGKLERKWYEDELKRSQSKETLKKRPKPSGITTPEELQKAMMELNPDYDGRGNIVVEQGKISEVNFQNARITDISPLAGMSLRKLELQGTKVKDLVPLMGMSSLRHLNLFETPVEDIEPLRGMRLTFLQLQGTKIKDISPLQGMPLRVLWLMNTKIDNIRALSGMPLFELNLYYTNVEDFSPLRGMRLEKLYLGATKVRDIRFLEDMPLKELMLDHCAELNDLRPLRSVTTLEKLTIPEHVRRIRFLRDLPNLKYLNTNYDGWKTTASEFWRRHDRR